MKKIIIVLIIFGLFFSLVPVNITSASDIAKLCPIVDAEIGTDWYQVGTTNETKYNAVDDDVNLEHDGDSTYIWHDTINKLQMFGIADGNIPVIDTIDSVILHVIAKDTGTGNNGLTLRIKFVPETPIVYYQSGFSLSTSYTEFTFDIKDDVLLQERDWIPSDFDNQQIEVGIRATGNGNAERRVTQMWLEVEHHEHNNPSDKPICIYPLDKITCIDIDTTLITKVIDIDNDNMNVSFYLDDIFLEKFSNVVNNTIVESSNLSLDYSKIYTWYVVVEDGYNSVQSDIFLFATTCESEPSLPNISPKKPILIFPDNNSINISKFIKLLAHVDDIDDDFLYVSFYWEDNSEIQSIFSITNYTIRTDRLELDYNTTYGWYVIVTDFVDFNISDIYTFTTESEPVEDENDIIPPTALELDYTFLLIGICLAIIVFILEFFSTKLKIKRGKLLSTIEFSLMLIIIFIMIFLKFA